MYKRFSIINQFNNWTIYSIIILRIYLTNEAWICEREELSNIIMLCNHMHPNALKYYELQTINYIRLPQLLKSFLNSYWLYNGKRNQARDILCQMLLYLREIHVILECTNPLLIFKWIKSPWHFPANQFWLLASNFHFVTSKKKKIHKKS